MYHLLVQLLMPFTLGVGLAWLVVLLLWRRRCAIGRWWLLVAIPLGLISVASLPASAYLALGSLEWWYPPSRDRPTDCQAIVVLGGHVLWADQVRPHPELDGDTLKRCLHALNLYRQGHPCPILVCGGNRDSVSPRETLAEVMRDFLVHHGVPAQDVVHESRSRNTRQNVMEAVEWMRSQGIDNAVVVTDATHLLRSQLCFEAAGLPVAVSGCRYRATRFVWTPLAFVPSPYAAADFEDAVHEWIGILWYWVRGWL